MQPTRIIKIFLASSNELEHDRDIIGNLVRRLDNLYEKRGIRIFLFEWEDGDAAYNNRRKQDEYNDEVRASDIFVALFHRNAGKYTVEEFDVATEEFKRTGGKPKPHVYCRDLAEGEEESAELADFKRRLFEEMGHYWARYSNKDTLCFHFVMQLQIVETNRMEELEVENGNISIDGLPFARMDKLSFAADNTDYQRMSRRLAELPSLLEEVRLRIARYPEDKSFQKDLQRLLDEKNQLQIEFKRQQSLLLDTAKRVARLQGKLITDRMRRAIDAFERGKEQEANIILDMVVSDAKHNLEEYRQVKDVELKIKEIKEEKRQTVILSIEELLLSTSTLMVDGSVKIEERVDKVAERYAMADGMAIEINYDKENHAELLSDYARFLRKYGRLEESLAICQRLIPLSVFVFGESHPSMVASYDSIGLVYNDLGDYPRALEFLEKGLAINEQVYGENHLYTGKSYNHIGLVYENMGDYPQALEYFKKGLAISKRFHGENHPDTAASYNNIGAVYYDMGDYPHALEYSQKDLAISKQVLPEDHPGMVTLYNNIGALFDETGDFPQALEYLQKALAISKQVLGEDHPDTATTYDYIGGVFAHMGDYSRALEYLQKDLTIYERTIGLDHPHIVMSYNNIGFVYCKMGDYPPALEYHEKALEKCKQVLGKNHPLITICFNNIGLVYGKMGDYPKALEYHEKALAICEQLLGNDHPDTATSYESIGVIYGKMGDYSRAIQYLRKALSIREKIFGKNHPRTQDVINAIKSIQ